MVQVRTDGAVRLHDRPTVLAPTVRRAPGSRRAHAEHDRRALAEQQVLTDRLQQAILPGPDAPGDADRMRVAVRYVAADPALAVGGDWYLSAPMPGGDVLLGVGDVGGHGIAATTAMAQLRHAMAGFAATGCEPPEILAGLNALLCQRPAGDLATAVVARFRPDSGELTWSRAGHPPILLANHDGVAPLEQPEGVMLGAWPDSRYGSRSGQLSPGDVVLMYTDGFVERPGRSVEEGVRVLGRQVQRVLAEATGDRLGDRLGRLVRRLRRRNPRDDACVLAAEPLPERAGEPQKL
jgi:serine phosphatase RsbU (regulator of sigma subunit)